MADKSGRHKDKNWTLPTNNTSGERRRSALEGREVAGGSVKLWVDDIRNPESFRKGENFHWAKTVTEAIRILDTQDVSEVSLDHDISMKVSVGFGDARPFCSNETYEPVARFIAWRYEPEQIAVTLHTANAVGAEKMRIILEGFAVRVSLSQPCNRFEEEAA